MGDRTPLNNTETPASCVGCGPTIFVGTTTPWIPVAMPVPATTTRAPGDRPGWKLPAFKKTIFDGPASLEESENDTLKAPDAASTLMGPAFGPAFIMVEAWPFTSLRVSGVTGVALPPVTVNATWAPENA